MEIEDKNDEIRDEMHLRELFKEPKIGDYVRTKYGIAKYISDMVTKQTIYKIIDKGIVYDNIAGWENCLCDNEIIKSSPNIIDLIEEGDYVNGNKITCISDTTIYTTDDQLYYNKEDNFIKSIVTKEQFEAMQYKVGE